LQKLGLALTLLACAFLVFVAGAVTTRFEVFPYRYFKNSFEAAEALFVRETGDEVPFLIGAKPAVPEDWPAPAVRDSETGVGRFAPELVFDGYTIYTAIQSQYPVRLIDMQGETVHQWEIPFAEVLGDRLDGRSLNPDLKLITVASARLLPNGDLLAVLGVAGNTPWGLAIVKVDKDSNLLWKYTRQAHHDLDISPDGTIYGMTHTVVKTPFPGLENIQTPFLDDQVVMLDASGQELQVVSVLEALRDSDYVSVLQYADRDESKGDFLHLNSINYLDAEHAAFIPNAEEGDLLISLRQIDVLAVLDPRSAKIKWAERGPWRIQHDPDILDSGHMLVFDNRGDLVNGGTSRVLEFNPRTLEVIWQYPGDTGERLYTSIYGSQQRLPNGNTLISESNNGRLLEVTRDKQIAWEYRIPERKLNYRNLEIATAVFAERFAPEDLEFLQ